MTLSSLQRRLLAFALGNIILAVGICLNAKGNLGTSAIMLIPYGLTDMTGLSIGVTSFIIYIVMVLIQLVILRRSFPVSQWLQILSSFISSFLLQIVDGMIQIPDSLFGKIFYLLAGIALTAVGASMMIASALVPTAPDGLANAIGQVLKKDFGVGKNVLDTICVLSALLLGLLTNQGLLGIGIGTLVAVVLTGQIISLVHPVSLKMVA